MVLPGTMSWAVSTQWGLSLTHTCCSEAMGQLLACADTNAATDNIVEGLVRAGLNVVRMGQAAKVGRHAGILNLACRDQASSAP